MEQLKSRLGRIFDSFSISRNSAAAQARRIVASLYIDTPASKYSNDVRRKAVLRILDADTRAGLQVCLTQAFGLTAREALSLDPVHGDHGTRLEVSWGSTAAERRNVPIHTEEQRTLLELAKVYLTDEDPTATTERDLAESNTHFFALVNEHDPFHFLGIREDVAHSRAKTSH